MAFESVTDGVFQETKKKKEAKVAANKIGKVGELSSKATSSTGTPPTSLTGTLLSGAGTIAGGPLGGAIGEGIGAAVDRNNPEEDPNRPKNRRLTGLGNFIREKRTNEATAVATLSQAVFDWAASLT